MIYKTNDIKCNIISGGPNVWYPRREHSKPVSIHSLQLIMNFYTFYFNIYVFKFQNVFKIVNCRQFMTHAVTK